MTSGQKSVYQCAWAVLLVAVVISGCGRFGRHDSSGGAVASDPALLSDDLVAKAVSGMELRILGSLPAASVSATAVPTLDSPERVPDENHRIRERIHSESGRIVFLNPLNLTPRGSNDAAPEYFIALNSNFLDQEIESVVIVAPVQDELGRPTGRKMRRALQVSADHVVWYAPILKSLALSAQDALEGKVYRAELEFHLVNETVRHLDVDFLFARDRGLTTFKQTFPRLPGATPLEARDRLVREGWVYSEQEVNNPTPKELKLWVRAATAPLRFSAMAGQKRWLPEGSVADRVSDVYFVWRNQSVFQADFVPEELEIQSDLSTRHEIYDAGTLQAGFVAITLHPYERLHLGWRGTLARAPRVCEFPASTYPAGWHKYWFREWPYGGDNARDYEEAWETIGVQVDGVQAARILVADPELPRGMMEVENRDELDSRVQVLLWNSERILAFAGTARNEKFPLSSCQGIYSKP